MTPDNFYFSVQVANCECYAPFEGAAKMDLRGTGFSLTDKVQTKFELISYNIIS